MPILTTSPTTAADRLRAGKVVAFPTETVYGLGADAADPKAVAAVYRYKKRPQTHPLIVHASGWEKLMPFIREFPRTARLLSVKYMPGPLTLLLPRADNTEHLTGGSDLIAVRMPMHQLAEDLLKAFDGAVAAPSANRFGHISPTCAADVAAEFADIKNLLILDGGRCEIGIESTIVGFIGKNPYIARPGEIGAAAIAAATGVPVIPAPPTVRAPGRLPRHYAPAKPMQLLDADIIARWRYRDAPAAVLSRKKPTGVKYDNWRPAADTPQRYASELYRHLRALEATTANRILVEKPPRGEKWRAVNDRLRRAVGGGKS